LGARYQDNPAAEYFNQVITAHPLGGCPMGASRDTGVVNEWGEVFGEPNLYVADGSVLPGPVGPNPALTIAALANRFADHIVDTRRRS
jgi:cholesterol oxidase